MGKLPKFDEIMFLTLEALRDLGGSATNNEIYDWFVEEFKLTDDELAEVYANGIGKVENALNWARTYLRKFGLIVPEGRGLWTLTNYGKDITKEGFSSLLRGAAEKNTKNKKKKKDKQKEEDSISTLDDEKEDLPPDDSWRDELLNILRKISPEQFERLTKRVLSRAGYSEVEVTGGTNDGGIDGVGVLRINLISFKVVFQCKRYKDVVGSPAIRDFRGAIPDSTDKALFVTTGRFTSEAKKDANRPDKRPIDLIDGDRFCELLKEHKLGVSEKMVPEITIDKKFFEDF